MLKIAHCKSELDAQRLRAGAFCRRIIFICDTLLFTGATQREPAVHLAHCSAGEQGALVVQIFFSTNIRSNWFHTVEQCLNLRLLCLQGVASAGLLKENYGNSEATALTHLPSLACGKTLSFLHRNFKKT